MNKTEVTDTKNTEGLSDSDTILLKNQINLNKESILMLYNKGESTIDKIKKRINIPIEQDELDFYIKHHKPSKIQMRLVYAYYANYLDSYSDLFLFTRKQYMKILILLKKKLLVDLGYIQDEKGGLYCAHLPDILSGNLSGKVNTDVDFQNVEYVSKMEEIFKIKESVMYQNLIKRKSAMICHLLSSTISSIMNERFTYVDFQNPDLLGEEIIHSKDKVFCYEILFFLNSILT